MRTVEIIFFKHILQFLIAAKCFGAFEIADRLKLLNQLFHIF